MSGSYHDKSLRANPVYREKRGVPQRVVVWLSVYLAMLLTRV